MSKQHQPPFPPVTKRRSATAEELATRQTQDYPPASPRRVGHTPGLHGEDAPYLSQQIIRPGQRQTVEEVERDYPDDPPRRRTTVVVRAPAKETRRLRRTRFHPLVFVGIGLFVMIAGWLLFGTLSSWWNTTWDDIHYGRPRTYQEDEVVGHNGDAKDHPSHFVAFNLNRRVVVIEFPAGDASKAVQYLGPTLFGNGQELTPVTLSFEDRNGDGKPDLNIHVGDTIIVFVNDGTKFVPTHQQQ